MPKSTQEHVDFIAIHHAANGVADEMPPVLGATSPWHRRQIHASQPVVVPPGVVKRPDACACVINF